MESSRRQDRDDRGFTLIELMVVVLIIAILIAVAIPAFLGARSRASDRSAQAMARNGLTVEKVAYTDSQQFTSSPATLTGIEPNLPISIAAQGDTLTTASQVYAYVASTGSATNNVVVLGVKSKTGTCFYVGDDLSGPLHYGSNADCTLPAVSALTSTSW